MALSSLSLTVLAWGAVGIQKDKGETPPACAHSGKELQGQEPWARGSRPPASTLHRAPSPPPPRRRALPARDAQRGARGRRAGGGAGTHKVLVSVSYGSFTSTLVEESSVQGAEHRGSRLRGEGALSPGAQHPTTRVPWRGGTGRPLGDKPQAAPRRAPPGGF